MQKNIKNRIKRIKGQVNGIEKMLDEDRSCTDVVNQIQAIRSSLASLGEEIVKHEIDCYLEENDPQQQSNKMKKLLKNLLNKS